MHALPMTAVNNKTFAIPNITDRAQDWVRRRSDTASESSDDDYYCEPVMGFMDEVRRYAGWLIAQKEKSCAELPLRDAEASVPADVYSAAYQGVRAMWEHMGLWSPDWTVMPGARWSDQEPRVVEQWARPQQPEHDVAAPSFVLQPAPPGKRRKAPRAKRRLSCEGLDETDEEIVLESGFAAGPKRRKTNRASCGA